MTACENNKFRIILTNETFFELYIHIHIIIRYSERRHSFPYIYFACVKSKLIRADHLFRPVLRHIPNKIESRVNIERYLDAPLSSSC